ncbi:hypothetical protein CPC735_033620 [Coccidioides posadasii C735 delta SOWgp]|uniref:ADP-ribosylation factor n=1 Tax=Coccidioides posadasii (strain C735) TaxID=222929 RepID=C5P5N6_COCP7|nr:hypothetical protein CPC735_033620 [Coccidioides posadasii C735 delta SOWgp]EER28026.1 hypothetical protein CPC735_033620 [Coccidioides posadasii C735 delta SOWgp]|eukprot:XP_003070171.1 hypothetical protein CPC735_033620 [Coccidioides posadasii C735 delta SOWgp]
MANPHPASEETPSMPDYYYKLPNCESLRAKLCNLDDSSDFRRCQYYLGSDETRNFVVDFDDNGAWCAFNIEKDELSALLDRNTSKPFETRWINIWAPERQVELIQALTTRYEMSHRLGGLMCSDPSRSKKITPVSPKLACDKPHAEHNEGDDLSETTRSGDIESGSRFEKLASVESPTSLEKSKEFDMSGFSFSQLVDKIWHFSSVDYGNEYTCIGYNSLYVVPSVAFKQPPGRPDGKRVWSWLIVCTDGTVISIQENPFAQETLSPDQRQAALKVIRRNTGLILSGISKQHKEKKKQNPLMNTHIRNFSNASSDMRIKEGEGPSLLFYYIFDDWVTNYGLVIGREHSYSSALEKLRTDMLEKPQVDLITDLHGMGRELAILKRLYQSYELIATRILNRQGQMMEQTRRVNTRTASQVRGLHKYTSEPMRNESWRSFPTERDCDESIEDFGLQQIGGAPLKEAALNRIERLADRIRLYALSEIEECLNEKETLTFLVFNLIAIKDSHAVGKLTRSTVLLSKVTILFLPVSLMTSYFSTEIDDLKASYTAKNYWVSFAVIMFLSAAGLSLFGWIHNVIGGKSTHRSIKRHFMQARKALQQRRAKNYS